MANKPGRLGVGLVGSGFMGKAHAFAFCSRRRSSTCR